MSDKFENWLGPPRFTYGQALTAQALNEALGSASQIAADLALCGLPAGLVDCKAIQAEVADNEISFRLQEAVLSFGGKGVKRARSWEGKLDIGLWALDANGDIADWDAARRDTIDFLLLPVAPFFVIRPVFCRNTKYWDQVFTDLIDRTKGKEPWRRLRAMLILERNGAFARAATEVFAGGDELAEYPSIEVLHAKILEVAVAEGRRTALPSWDGKDPSKVGVVVYGKKYQGRDIAFVIGQDSKKLKAIGVLKPKWGWFEHFALEQRGNEGNRVFGEKQKWDLVVSETDCAAAAPKLPDKAHICLWGDL